MKKIKVLLVDDERAAREELKYVLQSYTDLEIMGEARNAAEAAEKITALQPDLVFLDIQMPGQSGFDLLQQLPQVPEIIFITAFDQYALQAFDNNALDYLMKPVREERFARAMEKARQRLAERQALEQQQAAGKQIFIKDGDRCFFIQTPAIYLVESMENYSRVYFGNQMVCLKRSLHQWEEQLGASLFFRINRAQIINVQYIAAIKPLANGSLALTLKNGRELEMSVRRAARFKHRNPL